MAETHSISTGERMMDNQLRSRMSGFTRFVFGSCMLAMICGFAVGVMEAAAPAPEESSYDNASIDGDNTRAAPPPARPRKQRPKSPATTVRRPKTPNPAPHKPVKPIPASPKPVVRNDQPPVIVDDPAPEPPPAIVDDPAPRPKTTEKPGSGDLFEVPGIASGSPKIIKEADELREKSITYFNHFQKTDSRTSMNKAKRTIQRAREIYRKAKKMYPNDRSIDKKLNKANQLYYTYMKSSRI